MTDNEMLALESRARSCMHNVMSVSPRDITDLIDKCREKDAEAREYKDKFQQCCTQFYKLKSMALGALGGVAASAHDNRSFLDKLEDAIFG